MDAKNGIKAMEELRRGIDEENITIAAACSPNVKASACQRDNQSPPTTQQEEFQEKVVTNQTKQSQKKRKFNNNNVSWKARRWLHCNKVKINYDNISAKEKENINHGQKPFPSSRTKGDLSGKFIEKSAKLSKQKTLEYTLNLRIWRTRSGDILVELGLKWEAIQSILGTNTLIFSLKSMCTLEIRHLDCLTNTKEVEEAIERNYRNLRWELHLSTQEDKNWPLALLWRKQQTNFFISVHHVLDKRLAKGRAKQPCVTSVAKSIRRSRVGKMLFFAKTATLENLPKLF